jgi:putative toxin-antitoxin system antitoxin component (TIGR02293 family)
MAAVLSPIDVLGGRRVLGKAGWTPQEVIKKVRNGLPYKALDSLAHTLALSSDEISRIFFIPSRTLMRRKKSHRLTPEESDRVLRVARVAAHAIDTFEGPERAIEWLKSPNPALGRVPPLSLLDTDIGVREVERILGRIDHGVFS